MANVMTKDATVTCAHSGKATLASSEKLTVGGSSAVLCEADLKKAAITGCAGVSNVFDLTVTAVSDGKATKLTVGGNPVLLDTLKAASQVDPAVACKNAGQKKLTAK